MSRCPTCERNARRANREAKAKGELEGKPDRNGRVVAFSDAELKRRSELAKQMHREGRLNGRANGALGGKAVNRHRLTDAVLEHFRQPDQRSLVLRAYESNLKGKNKSLRLQAANALTKLEALQDDRLRSDRGGAMDPADMTDDELREFVMQAAAARVESMIERGELPIDGEATEIE
jgi:hypothetical protein